MAITLSKSYLKVHYGFRPAKQTERRIFIDAFQLISESGFFIRDYQYIGMGSIHFIDFALFHKYLGISKMLSIELSSEIDDRIKFNVPYKNLISIETGKPIGDFLSDLEESKRYVIWLDYDNVLMPEMISDVALAAGALSSGSILLITVDTEPPLKNGDRKKDTEENLRISKEYFQSIAGVYLKPSKKESDFAYDLLPRVNTEILKNVIDATTLVRKEKFFPLFNFLYADDHRMLTLGGMIANAKDRKKMKKSRILKENYIRSNLINDPFLIRIPVLTRKEQLYLESQMPSEHCELKDVFGLSPEDINDYQRIYRFYPTYAAYIPHISEGHLIIFHIQCGIRGQANGTSRLVQLTA